MQKLTITEVPYMVVRKKTNPNLFFKSEALNKKADT